MGPLLLFLRRSIFFVTILFSLFAISCNSRSNRGSTDLIVLDYSHFEKSDSVSIVLDELYSEVHLIELETSDSVLISRISKIIYDDNEIYINASPSIMVFDMEGRFLRKIGSKGRGPGEYLHVGQMSIIGDSLIVMAGDKVLAYHKKTAEWGSSFRYSEMLSGSYGDTYICGQDEFIGFIPDMGYDNSDIMLSFFGREGVKDSVLYSNPLPHAPYVLTIVYNEGQFYQTGNDLKFKYFFNDTIFVIKDRKLYPDMLIDFKNRATDIHARINVSNDITKATPFENNFQVNIVGENDLYVFLTIPEKPYFYNKEKK